MTPRTSARASDRPSRDRRVYPLVALSVVTGVFFFAQYQLDYTPPGVVSMVVIAGLTLGVPVVMGYTGYSFRESILVGLLPLLGVQVGGWLDPPVTPLNLQNMANALVIYGGMALPVVAVAYVLGVGLRDRDALADRRRDLALRLVVAVLIAVVVMAATHVDLLSAGIDQ